MIPENVRFGGDDWIRILRKRVKVYKSIPSFWKGIKYIKPDEVAHYEALGYVVRVGPRGGRFVNISGREKNDY